MFGSRLFWRCLRTSARGALGASALLALAAEAPVHTPVPLVPYIQSAEAVAPPAAVVIPTYDLAACKALALAKQPSIAAAQASLDAAVSRSQALANLRVPAFLVRDLPTRRHQAELGVQAAQAALHEAQLDTIYAVEFSYISALYARSQRQVTDNALERLETLRKKVAEAIEKDKEDEKRLPIVSRRDLAQLDGLKGLILGRQQEAILGEQRALSSLAEAMAYPGCKLLLANDRLLDVSFVLDCCKLVEQALAHRPEITRALLGAEVSDLEVTAQSSRLLALRTLTFAAGSDLHSNPVPTGSSSVGEYRPGAVALEMPGGMTGHRGDRVEQARIYSGRAGSVVEKTRGLVRLQVEQAHLRLVEANRKLVNFEQAAKAASDALDRTINGGFPTARNASLLHVVQISRDLTDMRVLVNEARYLQLLALIALERATGGAFCAGLDKAPQVPDPRAGTNGGKDKENGDRSGTGSR
jgi:hypothetical protein